MDTDKLDETKNKLSMRKSILVIVTGILLGWGAAFVVVYKLIDTSSEDGQSQAVMTANKAPSDLEVDQIEPAAGTPNQR
jgi:hypothetical protein